MSMIECLAPDYVEIAFDIWRVALTVDCIDCGFSKSAKGDRYIHTHPKLNLNVQASQGAAMIVSLLIA